MILTYRILTTIIYPLLFIFLYYRKLLNKEDPKRYKEKIFTSYFNPIKKNGSLLIWFHAASIGEFKSILPLIKELNITKKELKFLITTTTLSSGKLAEIELKKFKNVDHRYFPFDTPFLMNKFLNLWKPDKIFLVDSEIWPNLILKAKDLKIPIALINARLTLKSFKNWMLFPKSAKKIFSIFNICICSNAQTENFLRKLNLQNVFYKGNIKLIEKIDHEKIEDLKNIHLSKKRFWFAASTHKGEDIICLKTHIHLKEKFEDIITIIAPRHIERAVEIKKLSRRLNLKSQILNRDEVILENREVIIINYFGALKNYFKYAKSVFIGKSIISKFSNNGGQNPIEAAKLNCKIYHGPYVRNFEEIYGILQKFNITKRINGYKELSKNLFIDLQSEQTKNLKISMQIKNLEQKTLTDTMEILENFINNDAYKT